MQYPLLLSLALLFICAHGLAFMPIKRVSTPQKPLGRVTSPSGRVTSVGSSAARGFIKDRPMGVQQLAVGAIGGGLLVSTVTLVKVLEALERAFPTVIGYWIASFPILGFIFALAGVLHFTIKDEFANIYPERGAWGLWYLPGSADFWVLVTGVLEVAGGSGLAFGFVNGFEAVSQITGIDSSHLFLGSLVSDSALFTLLLVIGVTPANVYMFTHGRRLPRDGPEVPDNFHAIRGALQVVLFAQLYLLARPSLAALGI